MQLSLHLPVYKKQMKRFLFRILAILFTFLGIIGAVLPVMPTVPFLLAALYFAADEPGIRKFIYSNKLLKHYLECYQGKRPFLLSEKIITLCALWLSLGFSAYLLAGKLHLQLLLAGVGTVISVHILRLKNTKGQ